MTLGLCMIVKNESDVLRRALDGIAHVADEIVIVDTGSTDGTADLAREYTDKVFSFEWANDFAAARNFALSHVTSDYWMWLDADDTVPERTARAVKKFIGTADGSVDVVMMPYVLGFSDNGKPTYSFYRERILKNSPEFYWEGRVHEAVVPHGNILRLPHGIVHAKPQKRVSGTRNLDIYTDMKVNGEKFTPRETYYYARELFFNEYYTDAAAEFRKFLDARNGFEVNKRDASLMLARCYKRLGNIHGALNALFEGFIYGLPTGEACCELGAIYFEMTDYSRAAYWYDLASRCKPDSGSGAFIDYDCYGFLPFVWLAVCYDRLGDLKKAYRYHRRAYKIRPDHPSVLANCRYFERMGFTDRKNN